MDTFASLAEILFNVLLSAYLSIPVAYLTSKLLPKPIMKRDLEFVFYQRLSIPVLLSVLLVKVLDLNAYSNGFVYWIVLLILVMTILSFYFLFLLNKKSDFWLLFGMIATSVNIIITFAIVFMVTDQGFSEPLYTSIKVWFGGDAKLLSWWVLAEKVVGYIYMGIFIALSVTFLQKNRVSNQSV